jgi:opacity protein-like surface antigen
VSPGLWIIPIICAGEVDAPAADLSHWAKLDYSFEPALVDGVVGVSGFSQPADAPDRSDVPALPPPFGTKDSMRWFVQAGGAVELDETENMFGLGGGGFSYFIVDDLSLEIEFNLMYFSQQGDDAFGVDFNLLMRWHFLVRETWSLYVDGGAGLLGTTEIVPGRSSNQPDGGANLNFTPQAGGGVTFEVAENVRFFGGVRWYHISNANTHESNPARDSLFVYAGVSFPF